MPKTRQSPQFLVVLDQLHHNTAALSNLETPELRPTEGSTISLAGHRAFNLREEIAAARAVLTGALGCEAHCIYAYIYMRQ